MIFKNLQKISDSDILIHLGDICWGNNLNWHHSLSNIKCRKWLVLGNHDRQSKSFYLNNGWCFVCEHFMLDIYGENILFSHKPQDIKLGYDLNIHGHFHNNPEERHEPELRAIKNDKQFLIAMENNNYQPYNLESIVKLVNKNESKKDKK